MLETIYQCLPHPLQTLVLNVEGLRIRRERFGSHFVEMLEKVKSRNRLSAYETRKFQMSRLGEFLRNANGAPFWSDRFQKYGVDICSQDPFREIEKLPVLTRREVQQNLQYIPPAKHHLKRSKRLIKCHTSGTTGSGLIFNKTQEADWEQWAIWWRYRLLLGIDFNTWCGYFGGRSIVSQGRSEPPFWKYNFPGKQILFSGYHLSLSTAQMYYKQLQEAKVTWLHGYPSIISLLGGYMLEKKLGKLDDLRVITLGAESVLDHQPKIIQEAFQVPFYQHYGQAEGVSNISECIHGKLHVDEDFSYTELIPCKDNHGKYRIIGTGWSNLAFPLIRYDTSDIATIDNSVCSCGNTGRMIESIDGRIEDYITLPNGTKIGRLDHIFKDIISIAEAQIYQPKIDQLVIKIVLGKDFDKRSTEKRLINEFRSRIGSQMEIHFEYCSCLQKTKSGKFRFVVSDING